MSGLGRFRRKGRSERGSAMVAYLVFFPVVYALFELVVIGGRVAVVQGDVQAAAREAARQASVASGPDSARVVIGPVARRSLENRETGLECIAPDVGLTSGTNFVPGGVVEVRVRCTVRFSDVAIFVAVGETTLEGVAREPIDAYRIVTP